MRKKIIYSTNDPKASLLCLLIKLIIAFLIETFFCKNTAQKLCRLVDINSVKICLSNFLYIILDKKQSKSHLYCRLSVLI